MMSTHQPPMKKSSLDASILDHFRERASKYKNDLSSTAPSSQLLQERKSEHCLQMVLRRKREEYAKVRAQMAIRWEMVKAKQDRVRESLVKYNPYFLECRAKRNESLTVAATEKSEIIHQELEIKRLKKEKSCLEGVGSIQGARLARFRIFQTYLEKVLEISGGAFGGDVHGILERYADLSKQRSDLLGRNYTAYDQLEERRSSLKRLGEIKSTEMVIFSNYLSELRDFQDLVSSEVKRLEELLLHLKTTTAHRTVQLGQIRMATYNLYLQVCKQMDRTPEIRSEDTLKQLSFIRLSMRELLKLSKEVRGLLRRMRAKMEEESRARAKRLDLELKRKAKETRMKPSGAKNHRDILALFGFPIPEMESEQSLIISVNDLRQGQVP